MNGKEDIEFVSASNKLKLFMGKEKLPITNEKRFEITKNILSQIKITRTWNKYQIAIKKMIWRIAFYKGYGYFRK